MTRIHKTDTMELKKLMVEKGLDKIVDLSKASRVDRNTLSKVVNGEIQPSSAVMDKLILALDISPEKAGQIFFTPCLRNT